MRLPSSLFFFVSFV
jgi:hypothetical protein